MVVNPKHENDIISSNYTEGFWVFMSITFILILIQIVCAVNKKLSQHFERIREQSKNSDGEADKKSGLKNEGLIVSDERKKKGEGFLKKLLSCFDFEENASKVLNTEKKTEVFKALSVFDGVRVFAMGYVVMGHVAILSSTLTILMTDLTDFTKTWKFALITGGYYAVDVFFFMSGFLFYIGLQKYFDREISRVKLIFLSLISRYLRLLPIYLFAIFGITYILPMLWDGPSLVTSAGFDQTLMVCRDSFWQNLLYINNFTKEKGCVGVAWYLSNDMQFFLISILIFIPFNRNKLIRDIICLSLFVASIICSFTISLINQFPFNDMNHPLQTKGDFFQDFYIMPYIRITTYMLGLYFAEWFIHTPVYLKEEEEKLKKEKEKKKKKEKSKLDSPKNEELVFPIQTEGKTENTSKDIDIENNANRNSQINPVDVEETEEKDSETEPESSVEKKKKTLWYRLNMKLVNNDIACYIIFFFCLVGINYGTFITYFVNNYQIPIGVQSFFHSFNKII